MEKTDVIMAVAVETGEVSVVGAYDHVRYEAKRSGEGVLVTFEGLVVDDQGKKGSVSLMFPNTTIHNLAKVLELAIRCP